MQAHCSVQLTTQHILPRLHELGNYLESKDLKIYFWLISHLSMQLNILPTSDSNAVST